MYVLGLDPGLIHTGWGIVNFVNNRISPIACGTISPPTKEKMSVRLHYLYDNLTKIIGKYNIETAAIEEVFCNKNPKTSLKLGQARGVVMLAPASFNISVDEYSPRTIKQAVTGTGTASKAQIMMMVQTLLPNISVTSEDAGDALAVAICHGNTIGGNTIGGNNIGGNTIGGGHTTGGNNIERYTTGSSNFKSQTNIINNMKAI